MTNSNLQATPSASRLHIVLLGRTNSGKSSLLNALAGQQVAIVSPIAGTTTDPVNKPIEIKGLGPCVLVDTAGMDDEGRLGGLRRGKTLDRLAEADLAILVVDASEITLSDDGRSAPELPKDCTQWLRHVHVPKVVALNKCDLRPDSLSLARRLQETLGMPVVAVSALGKQGVADLISALVAIVPKESPRTITGKLAKKGDVVVLVMPQDAQAPQGRLILPQAQTIRELLDKQCIGVTTTPDMLPKALEALQSPPSLIITDSQAFTEVERLCPPETRLTSFSILFSAYKGDLPTLVEGAKNMANLTAQSRVLIAEACSHAPLSEDIGRVKIPRMLRQRVGEGLRVEVVAGTDFPEDLRDYDLVIHCGACMFNRKQMLHRIAEAQAQGVPITNYGIAIAWLKGILDRVAFP
jgi:[FeFe] hydrogenase H-cluster maturation GTPase HydF